MKVSAETIQVVTKFSTSANRKLHRVRNIHTFFAGLSLAWKQTFFKLDGCRYGANSFVAKQGIFEKRKKEVSALSGAENYVIGLFAEVLRNINDINLQTMNQTPKYKFW